MSLPNATSPLGGHSTTSLLVDSSLTCPLPLHHAPDQILPSPAPHRPLARSHILQRFIRVAKPAPCSVAGHPHPWGIPLYQLTIGLGVPVTRHASLTVSPSSAVQSASSSSNSGGPEDTQGGPQCYMCSRLGLQS